MKRYIDSIESINKLNHIIQDSTFWIYFRVLLSIFKFIHNHQKIFESNKTGLNRVYPCWIEINSHLHNLTISGSTPFWKNIKAYFECIEHNEFEIYIQAQLQAIHLAIYILIPINNVDPFLPRFI